MGLNSGFEGLIIVMTVMFKNCIYVAGCLRRIDPISIVL